MDWRSRKYYLVSIPYFCRDMRINYFKIAAPSIKMSEPYNHVAHKIGRYGSDYKYDGQWCKETGVHRPDYMISCKTEESEALEYELRKMVRNDGYYGAFYELTKEFCGQ